MSNDSLGGVNAMVVTACGVAAGMLWWQYISRHTVVRKAEAPDTSVNDGISSESEGEESAAPPYTAGTKPEPLPLTRDEDGQLQEDVQQPSTRSVNLLFT